MRDKANDSYDLDTEAGMANAVRWTTDMLGHLKEGGVWAIPRSGLMIEVVSHKDKTYRINDEMLSALDPAVERVMQAAGWCRAD
jgi:hypothetical protein